MNEALQPIQAGRERIEIRAVRFAEQILSQQTPTALEIATNSRRPYQRARQLFALAAAKGLIAFPPEHERHNPKHYARLAWGGIAR
jgi:hypothetical protein